MDSGLRYEILETINSDFQEQLRSSKATIFRKGLDKDDLFKEPLSIFFSSMIAFGNTITFLLIFLISQIIFSSICEENHVRKKYLDDSLKEFMIYVLNFEKFSFNFILLI